VVFVALGPLADPSLVIPTVSQALGLPETDAPLADRLRELTRHGQLLLVLDNFEHLLEAALEVSKLLAGVPGLSVLVTSRTTLHLSGEHEYVVPPLILPDLERLPEAAMLGEFDSVALFVERARAVKRDFELTAANAPAVAALCVRLDGLPLAIELAAARAKLLSPRALLEQLEQHIDLFVGPIDAPGRQQTLRATVDWSHDMLSPEEQTLFACLAVFHGGCTLEAADAICEADKLFARIAALVDCHLLPQEEMGDGEPRFTMLETIRAYAVERFEARSDREEVERRHAEYFLAIAEHVSVQRTAGRDVDWLTLERDHDNIRAALNHLLARRQSESFVEFVNAIQFFWHERGHLREGEIWLESAVRLADDLPHPWHTETLLTASRFAWLRGDTEGARRLAQLALEESRAARATLGEAVSLRLLGVIAAASGELDGAESLSEQAAELFAALGHETGSQMAAHDLAVFALEKSDYARASARLDESLAQARELGSAQKVGEVILDLAILALREDRREEAAGLFAESLRIALGEGIRRIFARSLWGLSATAALAGDLTSSAVLLGAAETIIDEIHEHVYDRERATYDEALAPVVSRAHEPEIAAALAAGREMSDSEAAVYALATRAEQPATVAPAKPR
jgi:predicted ATPase